MSEFIDQTFDGKGKTIEFPKGEYESCRFINCSFSGANLSQYLFSECVFEECDLSSIRVDNTSFKEVAFNNCKMLGVHFENANPFLFEVTFDNCQLNLSSFYKVNLKQAVIGNCSLKEVDFTEANLSGTKFNDCDFTLAIFDKTNLAGADLYSSFNFQIDPRTNIVKKAKFSKEGALGLLTRFDVILK